MRLDPKSFLAGMALALLLVGVWWVADRGDAEVTTTDGPSVTEVADSTPDSATPQSDPATTERPSDTPGSPSTTDAPSTTRRSTSTSTQVSPPPRQADVPAGFDTIAIDELPDEALDTIDLIEAGGPFPYRADDETFQNRERLLPIEDLGYYREYTVETPGSPDRGARRIVAGEDGETYYTDDHYDSFRWVLT
ncbi:MAG: ribonuclease domain-containing protein [Microthrixaceae bacterium]